MAATAEPGGAPDAPTRIRRTAGTGCALSVLGGLGLIVLVAVVSALQTDARMVTAGDFGAGWPLTVEDGVLQCSLGQVTFVHDGREYGINPVARRTGLYEPLDPIWADAPDANRKRPLDPLIDAGLDLCDP